MVLLSLLCVRSSGRRELQKFALEAHVAKIVESNSDSSVSRDSSDSRNSRDSRDS